MLLINNMNKDEILVKALTWNKSLYNPIPDPIDWMYDVLKTNTPAYIKDIALILLKRTELIEFLRKNIEYMIIKVKIVSKITLFIGSFLKN